MCILIRFDRNIGLFTLRLYRGDDHCLVSENYVERVDALIAGRKMANSYGVHPDDISSL